jgi:hypothetical protein
MKKTALEAPNILLEITLSTCLKAQDNQQTNVCVQMAVSSTFRMPVSKHTAAKIWPKQ